MNPLSPLPSALASEPSTAQELLFLFHHAPAPVVYFDGAWRLTRLNPVAARHFSVGEPLHGYLRCGDEAWLWEKLAGAVSEDGVVRGVDCLMRTNTGEDVCLTWAMRFDEGVTAGSANAAGMGIGCECPPGRKAVVWARVAGLSARETEVLRLCADAYTNLNIAARLGIAESTVKNHLKAVFRKMRVGSRSELAARLKGGNT